MKDFTKNVNKFWNLITLTIVHFYWWALAESLNGKKLLKLTLDGKFCISNFIERDLKVWGSRYTIISKILIDATSITKLLHMSAQLVFMKDILLGVDFELQVMMYDKNLVSANWDDSGE